MTRSSVLTGGSSLVRSSSARRVAENLDCRPSVRRAAVPTRRAAALTRPVAGRPHAGQVEYGQCGPGVSRADHDAAPKMGVGQMITVAVATAAIALGLIGVANLRADPAAGPAPTSTSIVQDTVGGTGTR